MSAPDPDTQRMLLARLFGLQGKVAAVTGAAEGIGREIAQHLAQAGARVAILDRNVAGAALVARDLNTAEGRVIAVEMDLGDESSIVEAFGETRRQLSRIDILVNCAGIMNRELITETSADLWDLLQRINSRGLFLCLREAAKTSRAPNKGGRVVKNPPMVSTPP